MSNYSRNIEDASNISKWMRELVGHSLLLPLYTEKYR